MSRTRGATKQIRSADARKAPWASFLEDSLAPEQVLPVQFYSVWRNTKCMTPERELAAAVLCQAALDLTAFRNSSNQRKRQLYWKAYHWVSANDQQWPYSFVNLCDTLGIAIENTRRRLVNDPADWCSTTSQAA